MRSIIPRFVEILLVGASFSCIYAKDFSTTVVDGLGRPVEGVLVDVHWLRKDSDGEVRKVELFKVLSDPKGIAKGSFDEKTIAAGEEPWIEISKDGYDGYSSDNLSANMLSKGNSILAIFRRLQTCLLTKWLRNYENSSPVISREEISTD
jgi:hypothetical protein